MLREHAITYSDTLTVAQVDYLCSKANRLGRKSKLLTRVYQEEDSEGKHVYFEITTDTYAQERAD